MEQIIRDTASYYAHKIRNKEDREDCESEIMLKCYKSLHKFDPSKGTPSTFFSIIAQRELCTFLTAKNTIKRGRGVETLDLFEEKDTITYQDEYSIVDMNLSIEVWIKEAKLTAMEEKVLRTRIQNLDSSYRDIGEILGVTEKAIDNTYGRVKLKLNRIFDV